MKRSLSDTKDDAPSFEAVTLTTGDGARIAARIYEPAAGEAPRGAVFIAGAMGVAMSFYHPFAEWLASEGFVALTFDYRGMGESRSGPLRRVRADIETWAREDAARALEALVQRAGSLPITWVGHSLGAQIVGLTPGHSRVTRVLSIAAGSGYWRHNAAPLKRKVWLFWWGAVPIATPLYGYFPGKMLKMVGDLPAGVVMQWRRWCMHPEYAVGAEGPSMRERFAAVRSPITALSFTDDEMMSERSIRGLHGLYVNAPRTSVRLAPEDVGVPSVGHFGFFRRSMRGPLWRGVARGHLAERPQANAGREASSEPLRFAER
jgi:predicted alpha/beta hydrolase